MITLSQLAKLANRSYQTVRVDARRGVIAPTIRIKSDPREKGHCSGYTIAVDERVARKYILLVESGKMQRPKILPSPRRYAYQRMRAEGMCDKEIAEIMGVSVQAVRMSFYYGKKQKEKTRGLPLEEEIAYESATAK